MSFFVFFSGKVGLPPYTSWDQNAMTVAGWSNGPNGISIISDDILYVSDTNNRRIVAIPLTTTKKTITTGSNSIQFDVSFDTSLTDTSCLILGNAKYINYLYLLQMSPISVLDLSHSSTYLYVDQHDNIYLTGIVDQIVFVRNATAKNFSTVAGTKESGTGNSQLNRPYVMFVDDKKTVYVADCHNHPIMKWSAGESSGIMIAGTGTPVAYN